MKIGFVTLDWSPLLGPDGHPTPGGAGWYRCVLPAQTLAQQGIKSVYGPHLYQARDGHIVLEEWDKTKHDDLDVIVIQRWMHSSAPDAILKARATGQLIVNDVDDWYEGMDPSNRAFAATHPKADFDTNRNHYKKALAASSIITVSTDYLANLLGGYGRPVYVVPNAIDLERWKPLPGVAQMETSIGWVGATGFRSRDLEELAGVLGPFMTKNRVRFHHSGHTPGLVAAPELLGLSPSHSITVAPMASIVDYPRLFGFFNVGIVPLRPTPFNYAKSAIKGMEYAASGIPFVATPTPEYVKFHLEGAGFTARRPRDWTRRLDALRDASVRQESSESGLAAVRQRDIATCWHRWLDAYQDAQNASERV